MVNVVGLIETTAQICLRNCYTDSGRCQARHWSIRPRIFDLVKHGHYEEDEFAIAFARIEAHYFFNKGFFETDDQLLRNASRIRGIPGVIVQSRYDVVCPMESAWALHRAWPEADLIITITPDSGHSAFDPPNSRALVAATDRFVG